MLMATTPSLQRLNRKPAAKKLKKAQSLIFAAAKIKQQIRF
jgi:hypothetical protein